MANIGVMGWEVPSLQEIHLKLIFQGSLPYRCVSESKWHTKERKTEWQWKTDALHSDICMHHWYSFTMVHPCKCTQILTNTSNRSSCNPSPAVSLCTTHVGKHSVIIPPEHSVFVWVCVCLREVHGMECFGSAKWNNAWKRESIDLFFFASQWRFTAVSMPFALFIISQKCVLCVFTDPELACVHCPDVCPQQVWTDLICLSLACCWSKKKIRIKKQLKERMRQQQLAGLIVFSVR